VEEMRKYMKNLTLLLNHNKGKGNREYVWCTMCRTEGHHKNECPLFGKYIGVGMKNPLDSGGPWFDILKTYWNDPYHFPMMQKCNRIRKIIFCNFCKLVGHEDKDCRTLEMMKERIADTYMVKVKHVTRQSMQKM
jgi:hypothetical protein